MALRIILRPFFKNMRKVKITVIKQIVHEDLKERYETANHSCELKLNQEFISINGLMPVGFCESAWQNVAPYVFALANGAKDFFDGWMKNPNTAVISCNDGIRPASFLLEAFD